MKVPARDFMNTLGLEALHLGHPEELELATADINRPGLALTGFYDYFPEERPQVVGRHEMTYLAKALDDERRYEAMDKLLGRPFPCLILSRGMEPPQGLTQLAVKHNKHVFRSALATNRLMTALSAYLNLLLAPHATTHGVLVDVYGVGLMITGESGMGKSETALELLRRGHRLVADDLVEIRRIGDQLLGSSPENIRHFMELRGIGIINIRQMYGIGSVMTQKAIDIIAHLEAWDHTKKYNRMGIAEEKENILDISVPKISVPVLPGRNLAIFMEVAARNLRLKNMGYNSAAELQRLIDATPDGIDDF